MKKLLKKILWVLLIGFILIQFFRIDKNLSYAPSANHISSKFNVPTDVQNILNKSCGDCHSNNTDYPWYSNVQPVAWWLANHIKNGKKEVNFDEFAAYSLRRQYKKFKEIKEQIEEDEMPLSSYTLIHRDSKLSPEQRETLIKWSESMMNDMKSKYPMDSLERKENRS